MTDEISKLLPKLISIGIALDGKAPKEPVDIEQTLIAALPILRQDLKLLNLVLTWAWEMGDLVHVERLKPLAKHLPPIDLAYLGAIAEYITKEHKNWALISTHAKTNLPSKLHFDLPEKMSLAVVSGYTAPEPAFLKFGFKLPEVALSDRKKLIPRKYLVEDNSRYRFRALFGTNWRADIVFLLSRQNELNPFRIAKVLSCSYETAHRIKKSLDESQLNFNILF